MGRGPPVRPHMLDSWGCWLCTMANTTLTHLLRHIGCSCPNAYPDVMQLCQDFTCIGCTRDITGRHVQAAALFLRYAPPVQQSFTRRLSTHFPIIYAHAPRPTLQPPTCCTHQCSSTRTYRVLEFGLHLCRVAHEVRVSLRTCTCVTNICVYQTLHSYAFIGNTIFRMVGQ